MFADFQNASRKLITVCFDVQNRSPSQAIIRGKLSRSKAFVSPISIIKSFACWLSFHIFASSVVFSAEFFQEYHLGVKKFGSRSGPTSCRA